MRRIISMLMENEPGALSRVVGLFSQRGYTIETLNVAPTDDPTLSRLTLTTVGDDLHIEQITKQLNKLVDVVKLVDLTEGAHVERDLMLIKVRAVGATRDEVKRTTDIFRGQIVDVGPNVYTIQLAGTSDKLDSFVAAMAEADILEVVRSGVTGIARGEKALHVGVIGWCDSDLTVACTKQPIWRDNRMIVAGANRVFAGSQRFRRKVGKH